MQRATCHVCAHLARARYVTYVAPTSQGVRSNSVLHCPRPGGRTGWPFPSPTRQTPCTIAVSALRASAVAVGRRGLLSFRPFLRSFLAAPQIQMKCLGMRQSITQSTPSPHEVLRRPTRARTVEREGAKEGRREGGRGHSRMGAVGLNVTDTFYAKNNPIYLNLEN